MQLRCTARYCVYFVPDKQGVRDSDLLPCHPPPSPPFLNFSPTRTPITTLCLTCSLAAAPPPLRLTCSQVKGPTDRLSDQQRAWLLELLEVDVQAEVCRVKPLEKSKQGGAGRDGGGGSRGPKSR